MENREKQIEEMANEIYETLMLEAECPLSGMDCAIIADLLVNKGYRKSSEVAREIFEKIEKCFFEELVGCAEAKLIDEESFAELKKKYTKQE